jgi:hypothetical protein
MQEFEKLYKTIDVRVFSLPRIDGYNNVDGILHVFEDGSSTYFSAEDIIMGIFGREYTVFEQNLMYELEESTRKNFEYGNFCDEEEPTFSGVDRYYTTGIVLSSIREFIDICKKYITEHENILGENYSPKRAEAYMFWIENIILPKFTF